MFLDLKDRLNSLSKDSLCSTSNRIFMFSKELSGCNCQDVTRVGNLNRPLLKPAIANLPHGSHLSSHLSYGLLTPFPTAAISASNPTMSRLLKLLSAQPISNTGSVARDHLANERTFLSWTRTGLGFVALGVALAKLEALESLSPALKHDHGDLKFPSTTLVGSGTGWYVSIPLFFMVFREPSSSS